MARSKLGFKCESAEFNGAQCKVQCSRCAPKKQARPKSEWWLDYEIRTGGDGKVGIYLREYNVRLATFNANTVGDDEDQQEAAQGATLGLASCQAAQARRALTSDQQRNGARMSDTQYYLIKVSKMCTSDEADLVGSWSAIIAEKDLHKLEMPVAAEAAGLALNDCPIDGIRPMTEAEIAEWRSDHKSD